LLIVLALAGDSTMRRFLAMGDSDSRRSGGYRRNAKRQQRRQRPGQGHGRRRGLFLF
jgi:hypothetical protein